MRGSSASRLLALLLAALPCAGQAARVALPPVAVPSVRAAGPLAAPFLGAPALSGPLAPTLLPVSLIPAAAPALSPAPVPQVSPIAVLHQAETLAAQALKAPAPEAAAPKAAEVFDQADPSLEGVQRSWGKLYLQGKELDALGEGSFGRVYVHPRQDGAVVKLMTSLSLDLARQSARQDSQVGRTLSQAGVGPAVLGVSELPGKPGLLRRLFGKLLGLPARAPPRPVVVKERVYGSSVDDIIARRELTQQDYDLVMEMLGRMADARLMAGDLRPANIMIGTTASDPRRRAYLVDGGWLLPVSETADRGQLFARLKSFQAELLGAGGSAGWANVQDPLDDILQAGLAGSRKR